MSRSIAEAEYGASPAFSPVHAGRPSHQRVALVDLLDRLLAGGVVLAGDVTISIAEVDLVRIALRALITSVRAEDAVDPDDGRRE